MKSIIFLLFISLITSTAYADADFVATQASEIETSTTNFNNNLSSADTDIQKALDTLDNVAIAAPTNATYITQTANGTLSAEQDLSSLSSGIMRVATTTGVVTSLTDSAGIASNISDETGTGSVVFSASPVFTGSITIADGSAASPSARFTSEATGIYLPQVETIGSSVEGAARFYLNYDNEGSAGYFAPINANQNDLGLSSFEWRNLYLKGNFFHIDAVSSGTTPETAWIAQQSTSALGAGNHSLIQQDIDKDQTVFLTSNGLYQDIVGDFAIGTHINQDALSNKSVALANGIHGTSNIGRFIAIDSVAGYVDRVFQYITGSSPLFEVNLNRTYDATDPTAAGSASGTTYTGKVWRLLLDNSEVYNVDYTGQVSTPTLTLTGTGTINGIDAIDASSQTYLRSVIPGYALQFGSAADNPADATTYFVGDTFSLTPGTGSGSRQIYIPRTGTIKACYIKFINAVTGTTETSTISIRLNNTTDTTISSAVNNSNAVQALNNTSLSIAVTAGDYIEIKWVTPTWATNPTTVVINGTIHVE